MEKLLVSRKEAAVVLSISLRAIAYLIAERRLKTRKIGGRTLIAVEDLKKFTSQDQQGGMVPIS